MKQFFIFLGIVLSTMLCSAKTYDYNAGDFPLVLGTKVVIPDDVVSNFKQMEDYYGEAKGDSLVIIYQKVKANKYEIVKVTDLEGNDKSQEPSVGKLLLRGLGSAALNATHQVSTSIIKSASVNASSNASSSSTKTSSSSSNTATTSTTTTSTSTSVSSQSTSTSSPQTSTNSNAQTSNRRNDYGQGQGLKTTTEPSRTTSPSRYGNSGDNGLKSSNSSRTSSGTNDRVKSGSQSNATSR